MSGQYKVAWLCEALLVSRSGYYDWVERRRRLFIESFWSSLKYEVVYHQRFATFAEARNAIFSYIETFITAPDSTPVLPSRARLFLNPN